MVAAAQSAFFDLDKAFLDDICKEIGVEAEGVTLVQVLSDLVKHVHEQADVKPTEQQELFAILAIRMNEPDNSLLDIVDEGMLMPCLDKDEIRAFQDRLSNMSGISMRQMKISKETTAIHHFVNSGKPEGPFGENQCGTIFSSSG